MKHRQNHIRGSGLSPAYRRIFERLDAALEKNTKPENYEKIVEKVTTPSRRTKTSKRTR
jgi:hypothetical protein